MSQNRAEYTPEEEERFLKAVEAYKAKTDRKFPTHTELLHILKGLGYRAPEGHPCRAGV